MKETPRIPGFKGEQNAALERLLTEWFAEINRGEICMTVFHEVPRPRQGKVGMIVLVDEPSNKRGIYARFPDRWYRLAIPEKDIT